MAGFANVDDVAIGEQLSSTKYNSQITANLRFLGPNRPSAKVYTTYDSPVAPTVLSQVLFHSKAAPDGWDNAGIFNPVSAPGQLVVPFAGRWKFTMLLSIQAGNSHSYYLQVLKNGGAPSVTTARKAGSAAASLTWHDQIIYEDNCVAGDWFGLSWWHNDVGNLNTLAGSWAQLEWTGS